MTQPASAGISQPIDMERIEQLTGTYAEAHDALAEDVRELERDIEALKNERMVVIRERVRAAAQAKDALHAAIEARPDLFQRPRTIVVQGVRVGYKKERGKVDVPDEPATIARIEKLLPEEQAELLIRVTKAVHKPAVYDLETRDLKRLGIRVTDDTDVVVIKPTDSEVDKLVSKLLSDATRVETEGT